MWKGEGIWPELTNDAFGVAEHSVGEDVHRAGLANNIDRRHAKMFHFPSIEAHVTLPPDEQHSAIIAFSRRPGHSAAPLLRMFESRQGITLCAEALAVILRASLPVDDLSMV
jgi:hypothetical protein